MKNLHFCNMSRRLSERKAKIAASKFLKCVVGGKDVEHGTPSSSSSADLSTLKRTVKRKTSGPEFIEENPLLKQHSLKSSSKDISRSKSHKPPSSSGVDKKLRQTSPLKKSGDASPKIGTTCSPKRAFLEEQNESRVCSPKTVTDSKNVLTSARRSPRKVTCGTNENVKMSSAQIAGVTDNDNTCSPRIVPTQKELGVSRSPIKDQLESPTVVLLRKLDHDSCAENLQCSPSNQNESIFCESCSPNSSASRVARKIAFNGNSELPNDNKAMPDLCKGPLVAENDAAVLSSCRDTTSQTLISQETTDPGTSNSSDTLNSCNELLGTAEIPDEHSQPVETSIHEFVPLPNQLSLSPRNALGELNCSPISNIKYPRGSQRDFLALFGLICKSDLPPPSYGSHRLHREAGGKLRRSIKPNMAPQMLYRQLKNFARDPLMETLSTDSHVPNVSNGEAGEMKRTASKVSRLVTRNAVNAKSALTAPKTTYDKFINQPEAKVTVDSQSTCSSVDEDVSSDLTLADAAVGSRISETSSVRVKESQLKYREPTVKIESEENIKLLQESGEDLVRRSARNSGVKRRKWGHLLLAHPDEYEAKVREASGKDKDKAKTVQPGKVTGKQPSVMPSEESSKPEVKDLKKQLSRVSSTKKRPVNSSSDSESNKKSRVLSKPNSAQPSSAATVDKKTKPLLPTTNKISKIVDREEGTRMDRNVETSVLKYRKPESDVVLSEEDLLCKEEMIESDSSNHSTEGTEILQIQLKARTAQIFQSLGVAELPNSTSPTHPTALTTPTDRAMYVEDDENDSNMNVEPAEYAAEVCIGDGDGDSDSSDDDVVICSVEYQGGVHESSDLQTGGRTGILCNEDGAIDDVELYGSDQIDDQVKAVAGEKLDKQNNTSKNKTGDRKVQTASLGAETALKKTKAPKKSSCLEVSNQAVSASQHRINKNGLLMLLKAADTELNEHQSAISRQKRLQISLMHDVNRIMKQLKQRQAQIAKYDQEKQELDRCYETLSRQLTDIRKNTQLYSHLISLLDQDFTNKDPVKCNVLREEEENNDKQSSGGWSQLLPVSVVNEMVPLDDRMKVVKENCECSDEPCSAHLRPVAHSQLQGKMQMLDSSLAAVPEVSVDCELCSTEPSLPVPQKTKSQQISVCSRDGENSNQLGRSTVASRPSNSLFVKSSCDVAALPESSCVATVSIVKSSNLQLVNSVSNFSRMSNHLLNEPVTSVSASVHVVNQPVSQATGQMYSSTLLELSHTVGCVSSAETVVHSIVQRTGNLAAAASVDQVCQDQFPSVGENGYDSEVELCCYELGSVSKTTAPFIQSFPDMLTPDPSCSSQESKSSLDY